MQATLAELVGDARRARRRHRHHRPAGDGRGVGPPHRPARCTAPSCGRTGAPPPAATRSADAGHLRRSCAARTGLVLDPYFSAHQARVAARPRAASTPDADLAFGTVDSWLLWNLTGGAVHATEPSNASRTMLFDIRALALVRRAAATCFGVPARALPEVRPVERPLRRHRRRRRLPAGIPVARHRRRPAGRPVRPGLPRAGHDQEHLRHRRFVLMNVGDRPAPSRSRACSPPSAWDARPTAAPPTPSRAPSSSPAPPCSGCATASASSTTPPRSGRWPRRCADTERRRPRARLHRPRQPVVGPVRPRHDRRHHPRHRPRPTSPGPRSSRWPSRPATWSTP